ncbi:MAG: hypothetical protein JJE18_04525 [Eubacteriaceae bacterium]|nr:hypothetical protein [Eubacteriaceae bacterium]
MKLIKRLTDNYKKLPSSNIGKLFTVIDLEIENLKDTLKTVELYRKIDNAIGVTLDNMGKNVGQERGALDDVSYRLLLKVKVRANISGGQTETLNEISTVLLGDNFIQAREVWNDVSYGNEPAAVELRYINFFNQIKDQYQNIEEDMTYLDGTYALDGAIALDGGLTFFYSDYEQKIIDAMIQARQMINYVKAGGVAAHWCEPIAITTGILTDVGLDRIVALGTFPTITHIGFGTNGHDHATGDILTPNISATVVPGEVINKTIESFQLLDIDTAETFGTLDFSEGNGNSISTYGLYEGSNLIALFYATPSPKTTDTRLSIAWYQDF